MTKVKLFILLALLFAGLSQCNKRGDTAECVSPDADVNPNKSSELAKLMRAMASYAESIRGSVIAGNLNDTFPAQFEKIKTAIPTDDKIKGPLFDEFAGAYIHNMKKLHEEKVNLQDNYNAVVNTCISCHETSCPGPIRRIEKLKI